MVYSKALCGGDSFWRDLVQNWLISFLISHHFAFFSSRAGLENILSAPTAGDGSFSFKYSRIALPVQRLERVYFYQRNPLQNASIWLDARLACERGARKVRIVEPLCSSLNH